MYTWIQKRRLKNIRLINNLEIKNSELKECIDDYAKGSKIKTESYKLYRDNRINDFEEKLKEADELTNKSLIKLVEEYNLKIYSENRNSYEFIKSKI